MENEVPLCVQNSPKGVLEYGDFEENKEKKIYAVSKNMLVKAERWDRNGVELRK